MLDDSLADLELALSPGMRAAVEAHARLLVAWNAHINLTAIRTDPGVALEHVADSLAAVPVLREWLRERAAPGTRSVGVLDIGSGGGFPGLPVAIVLPAGRTVLVESVGKKAAFLRVAVAAAGAAQRAAGEAPPAIGVLPARAETLAVDAGVRGAWDIVIARAVAALPHLAALAWPLLRHGGLLVAWKRDAGDGALEAEVGTLSKSLDHLGAASVRVVPVPVAGLADHRLVLVEKPGALLP